MGAEGEHVGEDGCRKELMEPERESDLNQNLLIKRERLLKELSGKGREAGISVVCAPQGFGKTALLLQYVSSVANDPARGSARLIEAGGRDSTQLSGELLSCADGLSPAMHPLVAIDDLPLLDDEGAAQLASLLRTLREKGFELVVSCGPENRVFTALMTDSFKLGAQALLVRPREYADWTRAFSISSSLDVYGLTQGVPSLVVLMKSITGNRSGFGALERGVVSLYRSILEPLRRAHDPLYRICCMLLLLEQGTLADLERCGVRMRAEYVTRLARDYPVFGFDAERRCFACMATKSAEMTRLRKDIAGHRSAFAPKAARVLLQLDRVDDAVRLADQLLDTEAALELIGQFPAAFATSGNALFVHRTVSQLSGEDVARAPVSVLLAVYLAALTLGEYRLARAMCGALCRRANEIEQEVDADTWATARAMSELWNGCSGTELPQLSERYERLPIGGAGALLRAHAGAYREMVAAEGKPVRIDCQELDPAADTGTIDLPAMLLTCDKLLDDSLHGSVDDPSGWDERLQNLSEELTARRLVPLSAHVRMTAATCRLMAGLPIVDERAFIDAGTVAVRESDFPTQLFCLLGEGWQALAMGQGANARFRAQQVLKLSDAGQVFLRSWASLLECTAYLMNTSRVTIYEEAELLDLASEQVSPATAWTVALHLAAARFDSELAAWYSMHKDILLDVRFCPLARLAMMHVGERADSIRRLMPLRVVSRYLLGGGDGEDADRQFEVAAAPSLAPLGQVSINLFGGFLVERNGHMLTDDIWRRKKASILAARLALVPGSFVGRRTITEEMWPKTPYNRARENLYASLSMLRAAFGQVDNGPQYVLTQGDGVALNSEFVISDTSRFDMLSREILLKRNGVAGRQIVESCLKVEQIYKGPLYVPNSGDPTVFVHAQKAYSTKFVDCMLRGVDIALELDDMPSASWLIEAALKNDPLREDVVRHAMRVYDLSGRRREVVELYNSHLYYLKHELNALPDDETRRAYEEIIERSKIPVLM